MTKTFKIYHIICEGSSEEAYLKELNKYLREVGCDMFFNYYNLYGIAEYKKIKKKYREAEKNKKKTDEIFIWLDNDVFKRNKLSKHELQQVLKFQGIKYNYQNLEDFLVMHLSDKQVDSWHSICHKENHFDNPMNKTTVAKLIQQIFPGYTKGFLPQEIQINENSLKKLYENQKKLSIKFKSDFVEVINQLLKNEN